jgi:ribosomal protein S18 acetylase RimI-like enzyme
MTMTEDFVIREYRNSDHAQVAALNAYGLAAAGVPADADVYAGDLDDINATYLSRRGTLLVGQLGDDVVAMGALREIDPTTCEITRMRVAPQVQGRGYGKAMLARLEEIARSHGYRRATLLTGPDQRPAIDLYAAANYTVIGTERHDMLVGVRMSKQLQEFPGPP